jgi:hypothetical protein
MPRSTETISLTLRPDTLKAVDRAAQVARRSRSQFVDLTLERALTGPGRLEALEAVAAAAVEAASVRSERTPNASALIANSCADGCAQLEALQKIATTSGGPVKEA